MIIIVFSVYNSILIPYDVAYGLEYSLTIEIIDRIVDAMFVGDIAINFRSVYKDYKTDELVTNSKKIALRYILNGRFWVDLIASMPLEIIALLMPSGGSIDVRFLGMLKLVRLLRLGRMITFLKANQKLKISMKIGQILFFLLLTIHWIN